MSDRIIVDNRWLVIKRTMVNRSLSMRTYWNGRRWVKNEVKALDYESARAAHVKARSLDERCHVRSFVEAKKVRRDYPYNGPWPPT